MQAMYRKLLFMNLFWKRNLGEVGEKRQNSFLPRLKNILVSDFVEDEKSLFKQRQSISV